MGRNLGMGRRDFGFRCSESVAREEAAGERKESVGATPEETRANE